MTPDRDPTRRAGGAAPNRRIDALARVLRTALPAERERALVRACLLSGDEGREAWHGASSVLDTLVEALKQDLQIARSLVPLLAAAQSRNQVSLESATQTVLRTAWVREELRQEVFEDVVAQVDSVLSAAGIPYVLVGGVAALATVYDALGVRHTHGIDLAVHEREVDGAREALAKAGLTPHPKPAPNRRRPCIVKHETGVPVTLWNTSLRELGSVRIETIERRATHGQLAGRAVPVLAADDALLHACVSGLDATYLDGLLWACDGWLIADRRVIDWDRLAASARAAGIGLPAWVVLDWLATHLNANVPAAVLAALQKAAGETAPAVRDLLLYWTRERVGVGPMFRAAPTRRDRWSLLMRVLFPSPAYMRLARPGASGVSLPGHYAARLVERAWMHLARPLRSRSLANAGGDDSIPARTEVPVRGIGGATAAVERRSR